MSSSHPLASLLINQFLESIGQPALGVDDEISCYICSEAYLSGDSPEFPIALACGHKAGSSCIMKWLSPLRNTGCNSCPQCRAPIFNEWASRDFPPPPPVVPMGNGPTEQARQIDIASAALSNIHAMLPPGGTAEVEVRGIGYLTVRSAGTRARPAASRQTRAATMDGRHRAGSEAVRGAASRRTDRPREAGYRGGTVDARARPELPDYLARAETDYAREAPITGVPAVYQPYRPEYGHHQATETIDGHNPTERPSRARRPATRQEYNFTRLDRVETDPARNMLGPHNRVIDDDDVSSIPPHTPRRASRRTTRGQAPPSIHPPAATSASSIVRQTRSATASARLGRQFTDSPSGFEIHRGHWESEEYREGRR